MSEADQEPAAPPRLVAWLAAEGAAAGLREMMAQAELPAMMLPALDEAIAAELRECAVGAGADGWATFALADRGRYDHNDTLRIDALWTELAAFAAAIAGAPVSLVQARWIRQRRGDYSLVKDDSRTRVPGRCLELMLDVSAGSSGEAHAVYTDGIRGLSVPQIGGLLTCVDRLPSTARYLRPPTCRSHGGHDVVRLIMQFKVVAE